MKVKFLATRQVKDGSGTVFEKDHVYDLPEDSAQHWLSRKAAVPFEDESEEGGRKNPAKKFESAAETEAVQKQAEADRKAKAAAEKKAKKDAAAAEAKADENDEPAKAGAVPLEGDNPKRTTAPNALKQSDIKKDEPKK